MNEVLILHGAEPRKILQTVIEEKIAAIISYVSRHKWHSMKVGLADLRADRFNIVVSQRKQPYPINVQVGQLVGISLKYGYGKFIFETKVTGLEPSPGPHTPFYTSQNEHPTGSGGTIIAAVPNRIEVVRRRSYFRVEVPEVLNVSVLMWHCRHTRDSCRPDSEHCWEGVLVDISAGGAQIAFDAAQKPDFRKGQFAGLAFTPMPGETPLELNTRVRTILPTADERNICVGVQIVGLETGGEGRLTLQRLCDVVERYYRMNQSDSKLRNIQSAGSIS